MATPPAAAWLTGPRRVRTAVAQAALKRTIDVLLSALMLAALIPVLALVALAIRVESRGPVLYRAERVGRGGRTFRMLKFRKMQHDSGGLRLTTKDDARFTRVGAFLARSKLDELPQLVNVLRGDMSLVGPRPEDVDFVERRRTDYDVILQMRPGITGLAQIAFAEESRILSAGDPLGHYLHSIFPQKCALDRLYVRSADAWMDLRILFWTFATVLFKRPVAVHRLTGRMNLRRRRVRSGAPAGRASGAVQHPSSRHAEFAEVECASLPEPLEVPRASLQRLQPGASSGLANHLEVHRGAGDGMRAVILAGGLGTRLRPYTTVIPKPLVPVGDRPVLEHIMRSLYAHGVRTVDLCVSHLGELIRLYLSQLALAKDMDLAFHWETTPLGTAGALRDVPGLRDTFIVMNGDILTTLSYGDLVEFHLEREAAMTVAVRHTRVDVDLGVVEARDGFVTGYREKPSLEYEVSMGIYVYDERALKYLPEGPCQFPELVLRLVAAGERVAAYRADDADWFDIGTFEEYERASQEFERAPMKFDAQAAPTA